MAGAMPVAIAVTASPAMAQTVAVAEPDRDGDILVTGVRQSYRGNFRLNEIPQAIATIDEAVIEENNIVRRSARRAAAAWNSTSTDACRAASMCC
jgi:iron complex outermembrane receptor protein